MDYFDGKIDEVRLWNITRTEAQIASKKDTVLNGDENGLRQPPKIAPIQVVVVPIFKDDDQKKAIKNFVMDQIQDLKNENIRIYEDWSDKRPGSKFNHWELKGVPIRIEIGQRDILNKELVLYRRDTNEKSNIKIDDFVNIVKRTDLSKNYGEIMEIKL